MANITKAFSDAHARAKAKNWDSIYILVDIHGTVFKPSYHNEEMFEYYPHAKTVLQTLSKDATVKLIMWTSSTKEMIDEFLKVFKTDDIHFDYVNSNPEVSALSTDPKSSDFSGKYYFNVGLDDKFGFDPNEDWEKILDFFHG